MQLSQNSQQSHVTGGLITAYSYDASGLREGETIGAGTPDAAITLYDYDNRKNLITMTDPNGKHWHYTYDDMHRRLSAADPLGNTTFWSYDGHGNKLTETPPGWLPGGVPSPGDG